MQIILQGHSIWQSAVICQFLFVFQETTGNVAHQDSRHTVCLKEGGYLLFFNQWFDALKTIKFLKKLSYSNKI